MGELRIMSGEGDTKVIWDPDNEDETEAAEAQFDALTERKFTAYKVKKNGDRGKEISKFDPEAGKIILIPYIGGG